MSDGNFTIAVFVCGTIGILFVASGIGRRQSSGWTAALAARKKVKQHRYKMLRDGFLCVSCQHNVRGASGRCPECGWPIGNDPK